MAVPTQENTQAKRSWQFILKGGKGSWQLFTLCSVPGPRDFPVRLYSHLPHPPTHLHCVESEAQRGKVVLSSIFWRTMRAWALTTPGETQRNSESLMLEVKLRSFKNFSTSAWMVLLLLLSRFSRVWLCVTPQTAAHQAPLSTGFSRQEHWSGLPFPSPSTWMVYAKAAVSSSQASLQVYNSVFGRP